MASSTFEQGLLALLGEETYNAYFTNDGSDHTPCDDQTATELAEHAYGKEGGAELGYNWDMDSVFLEASEQFEASYLASIADTKTTDNRFATPKSEEEVKQARIARIPKKTQSDTKYCVDIWKKWTLHRNSIVKTEQVDEDITALDNESVQYWMTHSVLEIRKKDVMT